MAAAAAAGATAAATSPSGIDNDAEAHRQHEQDQRLQHNSSGGSSSGSTSSSGASTGGPPSPKSIASGCANGEVIESKVSAVTNVAPLKTTETTEETPTIGGRLTFYKDGKFIFELAHQRMCGIDDTCRWMPVKQSKNHQQPQQRYNSTGNRKSWPGIFANNREGSASDDNASTNMPASSLFKKCIFRPKRQRKMKTPSRQINCHMQFAMKANKSLAELNVKRRHLGKRRLFNNVIGKDGDDEDDSNKDNDGDDDANDRLGGEKTTTKPGSSKSGWQKKKAQPLYAVVHALWESVLSKEANRQQHRDNEETPTTTPVDGRSPTAAAVGMPSPRKHRLLSNDNDDWTPTKQQQTASSSPAVDFSPNNNKKYCRRNLSSPATTTASIPALPPSSAVNGIGGGGTGKDDHHRRQHHKTAAKTNNHSINAILAPTPPTAAVPHVSNNKDLLVLADESVNSGSGSCTTPQSLSLLRKLLKSPGPNTNGGSNRAVSNPTPDRLSPHHRQRHKVFSPPIIQSPKRQATSSYHHEHQLLLKRSSAKDSAPPAPEMKPVAVDPMQGAAVAAAILMDQRLQHPGFNPVTSGGSLHHPAMFHPQYHHSQQPTPAHLPVPSRTNWPTSPSAAAAALYGGNLPSHYPSMMLLPSPHHHHHHHSPSSPSTIQQSSSPHSPLIVAPYSPCSSAAMSSPLFTNPPSTYHHHHQQQQHRHHTVGSPGSLLLNHQQQHHRRHTDSPGSVLAAAVDATGTSDDLDVPLNLSKNCSTSSSAAGY